MAIEDMINKFITGVECVADYIINKWEDLLVKYGAPKGENLSYKEKELKMLLNFRCWRPIETEEERELVERYGLTGWFKTEIKPEEGWKEYACLTEKGWTYLKVKIINKNKFFRNFYKLINFAN